MIPVETEVKLRMDSPEAARAAVDRVGAQRQRARHLEDNTLYDDEERSLLSAGRALRIRRTDHGSLVTFKGPRSVAQGMKSRSEIEVEVADGDALESILVALGYLRVFRYQKYRETYAWGGVEIVIDETPIGTFLEIEGEPAAIHAAAAALGRRPSDYITESYAALFFASGRRGDMVFE